MKKQLLEEINRARVIMGLNVKKNLLNEDGIITTLAKKARTVFTQATDELTQRGVATGKKIVSDIKMDESDYLDIVTALDGDMISLLNANQLNLLKSVILKNTEYVDDIYYDLVTSVLKNTNSDELQLIKRIKSEMGPPNNKSLEDVLKTSFPNTDNFVRDILFAKFDKKIKELERSGKLDNSINLSAGLTNIGRWIDDVLEMTDNEKNLITRELTPTLIDSIRNFFKSFDERERITKLQKYLKLYSTTNDSLVKINLEKLIKKDFAYFFLRERTVFETMAKWCEDVAKKYPNNDEMLSLIVEFKKLVVDKDYKAIATLTKLDGTLSKLSGSLKELYDSDPITPIGPIIKKLLDRFNDVDTSQEIKKVTDDWMGNAWRWVKTGSSKGWPSETNKIWWEYTNGNISLARRKYAKELFGRYIKLNMSWALLTLLRDTVSWFWSGAGEDKIKMCQAAINDKIKSDPKYFDKIQSKDELPYPCNLKRVLYGMQLMERQWYGDFFPNFSIVKLIEALREGRLDGDAITDFIPGKGDDVFMDIVSFFTFTENRDNLTKLKERIQADIDQRQKEIDEEAERLRNRNPESGTFTGDEKGFKEYLSSISTTDKPKNFKKFTNIPGYDPQGEDTNNDLYNYKNGKWQ